MSLLNSVSPSFLQLPCRYWKAAIRSPQSLLQVEQSQLSQPVFDGNGFHFLYHFCGPLVIFQQAHISPVLRTLHLDTILQMRPQQCRVKVQDHLPWPAGHTSFHAGQDTVSFLGCKDTLLAHVQLTIHHYLLSPSLCSILISPPLATAEGFLRTVLPQIIYAAPQGPAHRRVAWFHAQCNNASIGHDSPCIQSGHA